MISGTASIQPSHSLQFPEARTAQEAAIIAPNPIASLTSRLASGDEEAFREFHARYCNPLHKLLLVVSRGNEHEAREALQETLIRVARHARRFETEEAFWSWLVVVARNAARDAGRKQTRYFGLLDRFLTQRPEPPAPGAPSEEDRLKIALQAALEKLPEEERGLVEGKYIEEESVSEIASRTGLTGRAVESRLLRLRKKVRELILENLREP